ncbi:transferrin-binding protein-like solute binding protein, partial [Falsiroseomonas oryziterrae]|uniref:transferrin-binding protein-like solute binding protein n=1 Tax=Falsiroseomonas oryziterrae TaxID=2911368 RepID=UPI001F352FF7
ASPAAAPAPEPTPVVLPSGVFGAAFVARDTPPENLSTSTVTTATLDLAGNTARISGSTQGGAGSSSFNTGPLASTGTWQTVTGNDQRVVAYGSGASRAVLSDGTTSRPMTAVTYGIWSSPNLSAPGTPTVAHAAAFGFPTPVTLLPVAGTATYQGAALIQGQSPGVAPSFSTATVTLGVDWAAARIGGTIGDSRQVLPGAWQQMPGLTLQNVAFSRNTGTFAGNATETVARLGLTGQYGGQFFGTDGREVGGSFAVTNGAASFIGAFGASR